MNVSNNDNIGFYNKFRGMLFNNYLKILISFGFILLIFIIFQIYTYFSLQEIKKNSIKFFSSIEESGEIISKLNEVNKNNDIYSILSTLTLIQKNNEKQNYSFSNELYKEIIFSNKLESLYESSIAVHASYSLINASYVENTNQYFEDINLYISKISNKFESFFSIKKELEYLLLVAKLDINTSDYKNDRKVNELYNEIFNSNLISSSVKDRVKKIHEFHIYK